MRMREYQYYAKCGNESSPFLIVTRSPSESHRGCGLSSMAFLTSQTLFYDWFVLHGPGLDMRVGDSITSRVGAKMLEQFEHVVLKRGECFDESWRKREQPMGNYFSDSERWKVVALRIVPQYLQFGVIDLSMLDAYDGDAQDEDEDEDEVDLTQRAFWLQIDWRYLNLYYLEIQEPRSAPSTLPRTYMIVPQADFVTIIEQPRALDNGGERDQIIYTMNKFSDRRGMAYIEVHEYLG